MKFQFCCSAILLLLLSSCATQSPKVINNIIRDTIVINKITEKYESVRIADLDKYKISTTNYPAIGKDERIRFLIFHYTALDNEKSMSMLTTQEVSAHYLIPDD